MNRPTRHGRRHSTRRGRADPQAVWAAESLGGLLIASGGQCRHKSPDAVRSRQMSPDAAEFRPFASPLSNPAWDGLGSIVDADEREPFYHVACMMEAASRAVYAAEAAPVTGSRRRRARTATGLAAEGIELIDRALRLLAEQGVQSLPQIGARLREIVRGLGYADRTPLRFDTVALPDGWASYGLTIQTPGGTMSDSLLERSLFAPLTPTLFEAVETERFEVTDAGRGRIVATLRDWRAEFEFVESGYRILGTLPALDALVLRVLAGVDDPLREEDLARKAGRRPGTFKRSLARLGKAGLVETPRGKNSPGSRLTPLGQRIAALLD